MKNWSWKGTIREWANSLKLVEPFSTIDDLYNSAFLSQVLLLIAKKKVLEEQDENLEVFGRLKAYLKGFYQPVEWIDFELAKKRNHTEILKLLTVLIAYTSLKVDEPIFKKNPDRFITSIDVQQSLTKFLTLVIENGRIVHAEDILFEAEDVPQNFHKAFAPKNPRIKPRVLFERNSPACETFTNTPNSPNSSLNENTPPNKRSRKSELLSARSHQMKALERKLLAKEQLCRELFEENESLKDRIKDLESQIHKIRGEKDRAEDSLKLQKELNAELDQSNRNFENKLEEAVQEKAEIKEKLKIAESSVEKYRERQERVDGERLRLEKDLLKMQKDKVEFCKALEEMEMRLWTSQYEGLELENQNKCLHSEKEEFLKQIINLGEENSAIKNEFEAQKLIHESNLIAFEEEKSNLSKSLDEKVRETRNYYSNKFEFFKSQFLEVASSTKAEYEAQIQAKDKEISDLKAQAVKTSTLQDQVETLKREKAQIRAENIELHSKVYQFEVAKQKESLQSKQKSPTIHSSQYWNQIESETSDPFINPRRLSSASNLSTCSGRSKAVPSGSGSLFTCADEVGINIESKDVISKFGNVEEFNAKNREVLEAGSGFFQPEENSWDRLEELQRRNTLMPPHLRSCYPPEYIFIQPNTKLDEKEIRMTMRKSVSSPLKKSEPFSIPFERQTGSYSQLPSLISTSKPKTQPPGVGSSAPTSSNSRIIRGNEVEPIKKDTPTPRPDSVSIQMYALEEEKPGIALSLSKPLSKRKSIFGKV